MRSVTAVTSVVAPALAVALLALGGCSTAPSPAPQPTSTGASTSRTSEAEAYCVEKGGEVQTRQPTFGTNDDESAWVAMGEPVSMCRFQTLKDDDNSRIYVDLVTLASTTPTIAALAYLAKRELPEGATGNPATALCTNLGGSSTYGGGAGGGGMVNVDDPDDVVVAACVFPDRSFIDEWGIAYYGGDVVRGIDLSTVFRFDQERLPRVFG